MLALIFCVDMNRGISKNNQIPWKNTEDMQMFKNITNNSVVIMGKNTWLSINETPLENRHNIVVSTTLEDNHLYENVNIVNSLAIAINLAKQLNYEKIFICGGKRLYEETFMSYDVDYIISNVILDDYQCDNVLIKSIVYPSKNKYTCIKDLTLIHANMEHTIYKLKNSKYKLYDESLDHSELNYLNLLHYVLNNGKVLNGRNGETICTTGNFIKFDLSKGFPLLTTKKMNFRSIFYELIMFIKGETDTNYLSSLGINIWEGNTSNEFIQQMGLSYEKGQMGPMYGWQWRNFGAKLGEKGFDQLQFCIDEIKNNPSSRRILMTSYNPLQKDDGVLYPCHGISIIFEINDGKLDCIMTQRSADLFLGLPYNIASYSLLIHLICKLFDNKYTPGTLSITIANSHIYCSHISQSIKQLLRLQSKLPTLKINKTLNNLQDIENMVYEDIELIDYNPQPGILAQMVV